MRKFFLGRLFVLLVNSVISVLFVRNVYSAPTPEPKPEENLPEVFIHKIIAKELFEELTFPARVESTVQANVQATSNGIITELAVHLGRPVKKGDLIARIRKNDPGFRYAPVKVVAPVNGLISELKFSQGSEISQGDIIAQVTDPNQLKIQIEITSQDLKFMRSGLNGEMVSSTLSAPLPVFVKGISPLVNAVTGTASAELSFVARNQQLRPGALGFARFKVNQRKGLLVPEHAVLYKGATPYIRIVENGLASRRNVTLGTKNQGDVEILTGLNSGEDIIVRSSGYIGDKQKVKPSQEIPAEKQEENAAHTTSDKTADKAAEKTGEKSTTKTTENKADEPQKKTE